MRTQLTHHLSSPPMRRQAGTSATHMSQEHAIPGSSPGRRSGVDSVISPQGESRSRSVHGGDPRILARGSGGRASPMRSQRDTSLVMKRLQVRVLPFPSGNVAQLAEHFSQTISSRRGPYCAIPVRPAKSGHLFHPGSRLTSGAQQTGFSEGLDPACAPEHTSARCAACGYFGFADSHTVFPRATQYTG